MVKISYISLISAMILYSCIIACSRSPKQLANENDVLVSVGDSSLTMDAVISRIPSGLSQEDSLALFNRIVEDWVLQLTLADYAEKNISDIDRIDRMVESYRNNLIVNQYLESMSESVNKEISEQRIRNFYNESRESMILEQPIVKGVFLKVSASDESLPNLRKWLASFSDKDIDNIEKSGLRQALQYKYFKDEWVDWNVIAEQIPYRFFDADAFLRSTKNFETEDNGSVYLLRISDYISSGQEMPYEYARVKISEIIQQSDVASYREKLINDIYKAKMKEGILVPGLYNPLKKDKK